MNGNSLSLVVSENELYHPFNYKGKERDFERQIASLSEEIFGESTVYFDVKKKIRSKKAKVGTIPDGYLIDLSIPENPILYIVEIETSGHDSLKHIAAQVLGFELTFTENKGRITQLLSDEIDRDSDKRKFIQRRIADTYRTIEHFVNELVFKGDRKVVIVIDDVDESLKRLPELIRVPVTIIEFQTFVKTARTGLKGKSINVFTPLYEEGEIPTEDISTWYKFMCKIVDQPDTLREKFDAKFGLSKYTQGYAYTKDNEGEIEGIAFFWYKSHIDNRLDKDVDSGETFTATGRPVNVNKLRKGMNVYLIETSYDRTAGQRVENPKVRLRGSLLEVFRVDGSKETRIFPND